MPSATDTPYSAWKVIPARAVAAPRATLLWALLAVVLAVPGMLWLEPRTDGGALVPLDAPGVRAAYDLRDHFSVHDQIVVVVEASGPDGIYQTGILRQVVALTGRLAALSEVGPEGVQSLANEGSDRVHPGTFDFRPWLDPIPETPEQLGALRRDLEDAEVYTGTLIANGTPAAATAILVDVVPGVDRVALYRQVRAVVEAPAAANVLVVGAPVVESLLGEHLLADLATLIPLSVLAMTVVFSVAFRTWGAVLIPALEVMAAMLITFGAMGWLGVPIYLTIAIVPVILTAIGVADELHVFASFVRRVRMPGEVDTPLDDAPDDERRARQRLFVLATMDEMVTPIVKTSFTTALGFLSFALSPIGPVRAFGLVMAGGVLVCMLWSLTVVPAMLVLLPASRLIARGGALFGGAAPLGATRLAALGHKVLQARRLIAVVAILIAALATLGLQRLEVQDSWVGGFAEESALRAATARTEELFGGTHILRIGVAADAVEASGTVDPAAVRGDTLTLPRAAIAVPAHLPHHRIRLVFHDGTDGDAGEIGTFEGRITAAAVLGQGVQVTISAGRHRLATWLPTATERIEWTIDGEGRIAHPAILARLGELEDTVQALDGAGVGRVLGPHEHVAAMHYMLRLRGEGTRRVPETEVEVRSVLRRYEQVRGARLLHEVVDPELARGLVFMLLRDANFASTARIIDAVRAFEEARLAPLGLRVDFGGDIAVSQTMIGAIVRTQVGSLVGSLVAIGLLTAWLARSLVVGMLTVGPAAFAILAMFGIMGWWHVPLGVATSMFAATVLGIGVDYAIHLLERVRRSRAQGHTLPDALAEAVAFTAPALMLDAVAIGAAFGLLMVSQVAANARLGALVVISVTMCVLATIFVLPGLIADLRPQALDARRPLRPEERRLRW